MSNSTEGGGRLWPASSRAYPGQRCTATRTTGTRGPCTQPAIRGGVVCRWHGGSLPRVRKKALQRIDYVLERLVNPPRLLKEAARLAYADLRDLCDKDGHLLPMKKWPDDLAAAVGSVEVTKRNLTAGDGVQEDVVKIRLWDKPKNIEILMKYLGMLVEHVDVRVHAATRERLERGRQRIAALPAAQERGEG